MVSIQVVERDKVVKRIGVNECDAVVLDREVLQLCEARERL